MIEIAGRHLILREEAREGEAEDLFYWLHLEAWN